MPPKKKRGLPPGALHHVERKHFKVLFCGKEFPAGAEETRKALEKHDAVGNCEFRFVACAREQVATEIVDADVAVPLMTKIDETLLAKAPILKLVLQFGVGLEGVDEEACTKRASSWPGSRRRRRATRTAPRRWRCFSSSPGFAG